MTFDSQLPWERGTDSLWGDPKKTNQNSKIEPKNLKIKLKNWLTGSNFKKNSDHLTEL